MKTDLATASGAHFSRRRPSANEIVADEVAPVIPFLKWAGGKRWLAKRLAALIGDVKGRYIEPFLGSGAVFFSVRPNNSFLTDSNADLIGTYQAIKMQPQDVARLLSEHDLHHSNDYYYRVRDILPQDLTQRAARFLYLNRTCWNGLYRVNLNGKFNVPVGTKNSAVLESDDFSLVSDSLKSATLSHCDFEVSVENAKSGDVVFCDPPYTVRHKNNGFVKYNENLFSWADQVRLRDSLVKAANRGTRVFVTNADHDSIRELYSDFAISSLERYSSIGGMNAVRGTFSELLITSQK